MQTVDSIAFYFKYNSEDWLDLKGDVKGDWLNCGNLKNTENCICNDWQTIAPIISFANFVRWNYAYPGENDKCYKLSVLQLKNYNFSPTGKQYQLATENNSNEIIVNKKLSLYTYRTRVYFKYFWSTF